MNLRFRVLAAFALALGFVALANVLDHWRLAEARIDATVAGLSRQVMGHPAWVAALGGQLKVESREGDGSRFVLTVPVQIQPA